MGVLLLSPFLMEVENGSIYPGGLVGPGQSFSVDVFPYVNWGRLGAGQYDRAYPEVPPGWSGQPSRLYGNPLRVKITVPPNASPGVYRIPIHLEDEGNGEGLGNFSFSVEVVVGEVITESVRPGVVETGIGQPAVFTVLLENKGMGGESFEVRVLGLPQPTIFTVYVPPKSTKVVSFSVFSQEEEEFHGRVRILSLDSGRTWEEPVILYVRPTLLGNLRAISHGVLLFPLPLAPVFYALGTLVNLL